MLIYMSDKEPFRTCMSACCIILLFDSCSCVLPKGTSSPCRIVAGAVLPSLRDGSGRGVRTVKYGGGSGSQSLIDGIKASTETSGTTISSICTGGEHHPNFPLSFSGCFGQPQQEKTTIEDTVSSHCNCLEFKALIHFACF